METVRSLIAEEIICPEGETLVPYHNTCAALATQVDEENI
jgi:hypothetical protein